MLQVATWLEQISKTYYIYFVTDSQEQSVKIYKDHIAPWIKEEKGEALPGKLLCLSTGPGRQKIEDLHDRFHEDRIEGEWFRLTPEIRSYIEGLVSHEKPF